MTLSKTEATEARLREAFKRNWKSIHLAGHGLFIKPEQAGMITGQTAVIVGKRIRGQSSYFVERNPLLLSGLVLAAESSHEKKPGFLTAEDLGSFELRETDLVVLSACETGLGCTAEGDGVLGLTRAFLTAGARSVVSSLWKVEDTATSLLMRKFYQNLWENRLTKSEALRQAQLTVLNSLHWDYEQQTKPKLFAQVRGSHPELTEMSDDELGELLAQNDRGLVPGEETLIGDADDSERPSEPEPSLSRSGRTHPALWAAFILNGDAR